MMRGVTTGNARSARAAGLPEAEIAAWETAELAALDRIAGWQAERVRGGFVRRAHGDLHLGNLCLWHGRPVPFDALEFDEVMATIDVGYDLAFLLMDLDRRAGRPAANRVLNRYVARTGDVALTAALAPFLSQRAMVLAHVRATRGDPAAACGYLDAALAYLRPVPALIVAVGGLQATGKSTLARALAPELGAAPGALVLRSDETRKRLHGAAPEQKLPKSAYTEAATAEVFAALTAQAEQVAAGGHAVIADGTFIDPLHRRALAKAAHNAGVRFLGLWMHAPMHLLEARLLARSGDASDATPAVLHASARAKTIPPRDCLVIDATEEAAALATAREIVRDAVMSPAAVVDSRCRPATSGNIRMAIRKLLLPLTGTAAGEAALTIALMIARLWNAHVTAVHVRVDSRDVAPLAGEGLSGAMIEEMMAATERESGERAHAVRAMFDRFIARHEVALGEPRQPGEGPSASFAAVTGREEDLVAQLARLADLTVVPHPEAGEDVSSSDALHAVLFNSGRPVLLAPQVPTATIGTRICLGWNGTAESAAAVAGVLPWLSRAEAVRILSADGYQRRGPAAPELAAYLALHGVKADIVMFKAVGGVVGAGLLAAAGEFDCDLLAMGAYSHSRLRQLILGGVTRHVLENATLPVMMNR